MEQGTVNENQQDQSPKFPVNSCQNCGNPDFESDYELKLCTNCRNSLSALNIPLWLKIVTSVVVIIFIVSLFVSAKSFTNLVTYKRADKAYEEKKYITAQRLFSSVTVKDQEKATEIKAMCLFCHYYNFNIDSCIASMNYLQGRNFTNSYLLNTANKISDNLQKYISSIPDSISTASKELPEDSLDLRMRFFENYYRIDSTSLTLKYLLADIYYDKKQYEKVIALLKEDVNENIDFLHITSLLMASYRELKQFKEAESLANSLLEINTENVVALCGLTKIELKRKNDKKALEIAKKVFELDSTSFISRSNLALAYNYNNAKDKCEQILSELSKIDARSAQFYKDLISPANKWRD